MPELLPLPTGWSVRPALDADADALRGLIGGVYAEYPGCVLDADGVDADLGAWASHLAARDGAGWVVVAGVDVVVACVGVAPSDEGTAELKRLYVAPSARRAGLGAGLVALVERWVVGRGLGRVELWSDDRFHDAHRLYERLGYLRTGDRRALHDPSDTVEEHFVREL